MKRGLIVSCQALPEEPLHGSIFMGKMAKAAMESGAVGIRANGVPDILEIKKHVDLPMIGIIKKQYPDRMVYITPTHKEIEDLMNINVEVIALDATINQDESFLRTLKQKYPQQRFMADISTIEEGIRAEQFGLDYIGSTLVGYTEQSKGLNKFCVLESLIAKCKNPVIAEGNFNTPADAAKAMEMGAYAVVVGSAITRPQVIARRFVEAVEPVLKREKL